MNVFQHIKTGKRYLVIGIGRSVEAPEKKIICFYSKKTQIYLYQLERFGHVI